MAISEERTHIMQRIGKRIRWRRESLGLSQKSLAASLGMTSQQIQKYEAGSNMISAASLYCLSLILKVPIFFFFEDIHRVDGPAVVRQEARGIEEHNPLYQEVVQLIEAFLKIRDPNVRSKILGLAKDLSAF